MSSELSGARRLFELLAEVVELSPDRREEVFTEHDPAVADQVRAMLSRDPSDTFLESPAFGTTFGAAETVRIPTAIGPYRIRETLGEGGMGRVFLAEQTEPVRRRVALKVLRFAAASAEARIRFEAERHAMGRLDHPNAGKILEAGTTEDGLPFFAMELIDGPPITHYCDDKELPLDDRLRIFIDVCRAVDHAHHKLLLHRDLKPSNILVAEVDQRPVPKVIDFGIAKGLDGSLADGTLATGDRLIGTPAYMSPEALGRGGEIDVRSDVFSLGVLLYELLTGSRPWPGPQDTPMQILQGRLEREPKRPSTQVTALGQEKVDEVARHRGEDRATLAKKLRGDLDWIVMKAIAEDPNARYSSVADLADDLGRFLNDEPVMARPPTALYVLRKLVRRHRAGVVAAAIVLLALVVGATGTTVGFVRARRAEIRALAEAEEARQARDEAREVADFLSRIFEASGVEARETTRPPSELTALELLERGSTRIDRELNDRPLTKARLEQTMGEVYRQLGLFEPSRRHLESALELRRSAAEADPRDLAETHLALAETLVRLTAPEEARSHLDRGLELISEGTAPEDLRLRASLLATLGRLERRQGHFEEAERLLRRAIEIYRDDPSANPINLVSVINNLGTTFFAQGRWDEAEECFRQVVETCDQNLAPGHPRLLQALDNLAAAVASQGRLEEAAPIFEQALAGRRQTLGDAHPRLADSLNNVGMVHLDSGHPERAETFHREALAIREKVLGPDHPNTAWSLDNLARSVGDQGRVDEARELQRRALEIREKALGPDHLDVARSLDHLAKLEFRAGRPAEARSLYVRALAIREAGLEPSHRQIAGTAVALAEVLIQLGEADEARVLLDRGISILEAAGDEASEDLAEAKALRASLIVADPK